MAKATKQNTPSEQRKRRLAQGDSRNHMTAIKAIDPKYKGRMKRMVKKPLGIDHKQYDKFVGRLIEEGNDENDDDFEPEKESTSEESDDTLPGLWLIPSTDRQSQPLKCGHWAVQGDGAMEEAEVAASEANRGSASIEKADEDFFIPAYAEFTEADLTSFE
jgi:hypothetical protein